MPATHAVVPSAPPVIRREDAALRRKLVRMPKRTNRDSVEAHSVCERAWNVIVDIDRLGRMAYVNRELSREFGGGWQRLSWGSLISSVVRDYKERRAKAQHPLRKKSRARLKTIPVVGPVETIVKQVLKAKGINPKNVANKKLRRHTHGGFSVHLTNKTPKHVWDDAKRLKRVFHKNRIEDFGMAMTREGLTILATTAGGSRAIYRVAVENVIKPGFAQDLYRHLIAPKANTVALDESMLPSLPGALRFANANLRRWLRSRKAVGAIVFAQVSPVGREIVDAVEHAKKVGLSKKVIRELAGEAVLKCPHCGSPMTLRVDPATSIPKLRRDRCDECLRTVDTAQLLATRASAYVLDNWVTYGHAGVPAGI